MLDKGTSINDVDPFLGFFDPPGTPNRPKSTFMDPPYHTEVDFRFGRGEGVKNLYVQYAPHFSRLSM